MPVGGDKFQATLDFIDDRSNYARGSISGPSSSSGGLELGLVRTRALLDALGSPDRGYPIVHIAGTKGKGSTAAYVAAIGQAAGYCTGLSTSPHLHSFRERIAIDGHPISRDDFGRIGSIVQSTTGSLERNSPELGRVTAFELVTAMALLAFADARCNLAVVEVGIGGTFDATNVVMPMVSLITPLDLEHTQILGETIEAIAENKAGIIKHGVPTITAQQDAAAMRIIEEAACARQSLLLVAGRDFLWTGDWHQFTWSDDQRQIAHLRTALPGDHQMENAALAIAAWETLSGIGPSPSEEAFQQGVRAASLPGRFEQIESEGRIWVLDGAHTPLAAAALANTILAEFGRPIGVIAGMLRDKHPAPFFTAMAPATAGTIVTTPKNPRAIPAEELLPSVLPAKFQTIASPELETSLVTASDQFPADLPVVITGSFTLVAEARERFGLALTDR